MTITQIQCFCALIKYGSFSRAADALFMSQSSVSKHIAALEKECGFPLLTKKRANHQIVLTMEGQLLLRDCNKIMTDYEQLMHLLNEMRKKPVLSSMSFSLTGIPEMAFYGVIAAVNEFESIYPGSAVHLLESDAFSSRLALLNEETDIAFIADIGLDHMQFAWQNYCEEKLAVCVSSDNPLAKEDKIFMKDLADQVLISVPKNTNLFDFCLGTCQNIGKFEPEFEFLTSRSSIALDYLRVHPHMAFLTSERSLKAIHKYDTNTSYKVLPIINSPIFHYAFVWRKGKILSEKVKQFLKLVSESQAQKYIDAYWKDGEKYYE